MSVHFASYSPQSPNIRKSLLDEEDVKLTKYGKCGVNNLCVLYVTAFLFGGFVVAELIGALAGHSLSLLGDAAAMSVDVFTYFSNMYAEWVKNKQGYLDSKTRFVLEVYIPSFSVMALLGVTIYILSDAIRVIRLNGEDGDEVDIVFLYAFSCGNFLVDVFSSLMFYLRGSDGFKHIHQVQITHDITAMDRTQVKDDEVPPLRSYSIDERTDYFIQESEEALHAHQKQQNQKNQPPFTVEPSHNQDSNLEEGSPPSLMPPSYQHASSPTIGASKQSTTTAKQNNENNNQPHRSVSISTVKKIRNNLNMLSAFTHVGSDTLRTVSVFIAAVIATTTGYSGNLCDAWAAVVVSITIFAAVLPLCKEIYGAAMHPLDDHGHATMAIHTSASSSSFLHSETAETVNPMSQ